MINFFSSLKTESVPKRLLHCPRSSLDRVTSYILIFDAENLSADQWAVERPFISFFIIHIILSLTSFFLVCCKLLVLNQIQPEAIFKSLGTYVISSLKIYQQTK